MDTDEIMEFYLLDSKEQIETFSNNLIVLERESENLSIINDLFRAVHSLKGASATMGFTQIAELTHDAEDLLDVLRNRRLDVTPQVIDVLLAVGDRVQRMLNQVESKQDISIEFADLNTEIKAILKSKTTEEEKNITIIEKMVDFSLADEERELYENEVKNGKAVYRVEIFFMPDCIMPSVRAIMAIKALESLGKVIKYLPDYNNNLEFENCNNFNILFVANDITTDEDIKKDILLVSEIDKVILVPLSLTNDIKTEIQPTEEILETKTSKNKEVIHEENNKQITTLRVDIARMDNLINLVGEMVITRTRLVQLSSDLKSEFAGNQTVSHLDETNTYLGRLMNELQESVMRLRMVAVGTVFSRFPRLVRDLSHKTGKRVELDIYGEDTELDKTVVESIGDPLLHIIRNSVDHGIEPIEERIKNGKPEYGTVTLNAYHEGNNVIISVKDDGAGLNLSKIREKAVNKGLIPADSNLNDKEILNLIFLPGFSTADEVTDISGRGVGMDVVRRIVEGLNGTVDIQTQVGEGTTFIIKLPLTLAIIQALLVQMKDEFYAIPLASVSETLRLTPKDVKYMGGVPVMFLREATIPLIELRDKFNVPENPIKDENLNIVVVEEGKKKFGLVVDVLQGQQEIVIKSLDESLKNTQGISGATILGNGQVTLIIDVASLVK